MAKNWTVAEAAQEIKNNNMEAITDIGKRYPLFATLTAMALAGDQASILKLLSALPEYNTANKINKALLEDASIDPSDNDSDEEVEETKPVKEEKKAAKAKPAKEEKKPSKAKAKDEEDDEDGDVDYEKMGAYPLYQLCKKRGLSVKSKQPKETYIAALQEADGATTDETDDEDETLDYSEMSTLELYKECKARGIKVEKQKKADFYIGKLEEFDNAGSEDEDSDDDSDDDWGEDEVEETPKAKSKAKAKPAKEEKKSKSKAKAKPVEEDEDDDDDFEDDGEEWDI